jgi:cell fate regulator YaaT (PSP1 superfamily)
MPKYVVRYGSMRHLGVFSCRAREAYARGQKVIARTGRGQELGEVLCEATDHVVSQMGPEPHTGQILRLESSEDHIEMRRLHQQEVGEFETCRNRIAELELDMQLVQVERLYGGERVIIYYLSEQRVDFRELVKLLARDLQTRIEMRQIGVRDEAKLLADYGDCGKPVCCNTHLAEMPPVSMKMAKLQRATLDPTKISGRCGRLKCCLRYEYDTYQELQRELPRVGHEVLTREGKAKILSQEILTGELLVETEDRRRIVIQASDVLTVVGKPSTGNDEGQSGEAADEADASSPRSSHEARRNRGPRGDRPAGAPTQAGPSPPAAPPSQAGLPVQELPPSPEGPPPAADDGGENP